MAIIVVVEDDQMGIKMYKRILQRAGHTVICVGPKECPDGDFVGTTMRALKEHLKVDIVLTDTELLPRQNGFQIVKAISQLEGERPKIIQMSGRPDALNCDGRFAQFAPLRQHICATFLKAQEEMPDLLRKIAAALEQK